MKDKIIKGFSKLPETEKRRYVASLCKDPEKLAAEMEAFLFTTEGERELFMDLSENTISSFHLPYGIAPNFLINNKVYHVPMVIEESSVVAAAASSARFWADRGGFVVKEISTVKLGHVYFRWFGDSKLLFDHWSKIRTILLAKLNPISANMTQRGGGIQKLELIDNRDNVPNLFKLHAEFDTVDSMGANFINTCLEELAQGLLAYVDSNPVFPAETCQVVMSILSNYTDQCVVTVEASCLIEDLEGSVNGLTAEEFCEKMLVAFQIAHTDVYRATTHNKGVMNGVAAVLIATGNDFRAAEAAAHAFAARDGQYRSLSSCQVEGDHFSISLTIPLSVGTVGGITNIHPLARTSLEVLGHPSAKELMGIIAAVGLASNFSALQNLVTQGIQKGHMKLHLANILNALSATLSQRHAAQKYFTNNQVSYAAVKEFLDSGKA